MARLAAALALLLAVAQPLPAAAQAIRDDGWWVVLASFDENADGVHEAALAMVNKAAECGFEAFNDYSAKFSGFRSGLIVVTSFGAFASKERAELAAEKVRPCAADAYVKQARYAGE